MPLLSRRAFLTGVACSAGARSAPHLQPLQGKRQLADPRQPATLARIDVSM